MISAIKILSGMFSLRPILIALGFSHATYYRQEKARKFPVLRKKRSEENHPRKISETERMAIINILHLPEFIDKTVCAIFHTLLDKGIYLASKSTFYRILSSLGEVKERRRQRKPGKFPKPVLVASEPNQVWTWDISKLKTQTRGVYLNLYVIIDMFSRFVVGWLISEKESQEIAITLFEETLKKQNMPKDRILKIHSDRGSVMKSEQLGEFLFDNNGVRSFSRPRVSNDNPFSESNFKTVKYAPLYPGSFKDLKEAEKITGEILWWYNNDHFHSGINFLHPADVHFQKDKIIVENRNLTMNLARERFPDRFASTTYKKHSIPNETWINKPVEIDEIFKEDFVQVY